MTAPPPAASAGPAPIAGRGGAVGPADGGLSLWWPTPARATDHFRAAELERSASLHGPLRRRRAGLSVAKVLALVVGALLLGTDAVVGRLQGEPTMVRAIVGATVVMVAIRLPERVAGRLISRLDDVDAVRPVPARTWPASTMAFLVSIVALALGTGLLLGPLTHGRFGWLVALVVAAVVVVVTTIATAVRGRRAAEAEVPAEWKALVRRSGVDGPMSFGLLPAPGPSPVPNACALGAAGRSWILIDPSLPTPSEALPAPVRAFVVAHELTHLARRHPRVQLLLNGVVVLVALATVPALAPSGWPWALFGLEVDDPLSLPVGAMVIGAGAALARLPVAWILRALERVADAGAVALVGPPEPAPARALHLLAGADLDPPWWWLLIDVRPSPAQRLEYLARQRRSLRPTP